jgi:hypothetical protein
MFPAEAAVFFDLQPFRLLFLVPGGRVVAALALSALKGDHLSHAVRSSLSSRGAQRRGDPMGLLRHFVPRNDILILLPTPEYP